MNGITQYVVFQAWLLSLSIWFCDSSLLLGILVAHSFLLLNSITLAIDWLMNFIVFPVFGHYE